MKIHMPCGTSIDKPNTCIHHAVLGSLGMKTYLPEDRNVLFAFPRATIATPIGMIKAVFPSTLRPHSCE